MSLTVRSSSSLSGHYAEPVLMVPRHIMSYNYVWLQTTVFDRVRLVYRPKQ